MTLHKTTAGNQFVQSRTSHKKTSGSSIQWFVFCIAIVAIVCGIVLWRMRTDPVSQQPSDVQSLIDDLMPIPGRDFFMGKTEVTQSQWEAVMGENPSKFKGTNNPVECISWNACQTFLKKLNALPEVKKSGLVFRLPTEEEWEYACRAGSTGTYCKLEAGTEITEGTLEQVAWFAGNSDKKTHPVGQKTPNAFGLYDMHGNVWEWTQTAVGEFHVSRGSGWGGSAGNCESSHRFRSLPDFRDYDLGFRLCASGRGN